MNKTGLKQYDPNAPNAADAFRHALVAWDLVAAKQIRDVPIFCIPDAFSPTGLQFAAANEMHIPGERQGAWLFDAATGKKAGQLQPQVGTGPAAISSDGRQMATAVPYEVDRADSVVLYQFGRAATTNRRLTIPAMRALQFSTDGKWLAASFNNKFGRWDLAAGVENPVSSIQMFMNDSDPHFTDDTSRVLAAGYYQPKAESGTNTIWRIGLVDGSAQRFATFGHQSESAMSGDGRLVAIGDSSVTLYDTQEDKPACVIYKSRLADHRSPLLFSPDGKLLAVATFMADADAHDKDSNAVERSRANRQRRVLLFDTQSGRKLQDFPSHDRWEGEVLAFSHDGRKLAANSEQGFVVWSTDTGKKIWECPNVQSDYLFKLWFSDNGKLLAAVDKHAVRYFDALSGEPRMALLFLDAGREWFAVTPDGFFDGSERGRKIISVQTGSGAQAAPIQNAQPDRYRAGLVDRILSGERLTQGDR